MKKLKIFALIIWVVSVGSLLELTDRNHKTTTPTQQPAGSVTLANYQKIKMGMAKVEVFKILGKGEETAKASQGKIVISSYSWTSGIFGANCAIMFQNDKVTTKSQIGLK